MDIRILSLTILSTLCLFSSAQEKTISLSKGEALDLLLFNTNPESNEERNEYFEKAIPVALEWGYQPQYSTEISQPPSQGNYWPKTFILATWKNYDKRLEFTKEIVKQYPLFHERRRKIWTTFNLTYWKVEEDLKVKIVSGKTYIATAYWSKEDGRFSSFEKSWSEEVTKQGGKIILELKEGISPFGYHYNPESFTITEWESDEAFDKFLDKNNKLDHSGVKHVNQFILK